MIIEMKAIGLELKDGHVRQAVDYAANQGVEWVALIKHNRWRVCALNPKSGGDLENLYLLTRESMIKSGLYAYHDHLQATNKFYLAAVLLGDAVLDTIRRELRRFSDAKI